MENFNLVCVIIIILLTFIKYTAITITFQFTRKETLPERSVSLETIVCRHRDIKIAKSHRIHLNVHLMQHV